MVYHHHVFGVCVCVVCKLQLFLYQNTNTNVYFELNSPIDNRTKDENDPNKRYTDR